MGTRIDDRAPMAWQRTLAEMQAHGTRVAQTCTTGDCRRWLEHDVARLVGELGPDHRLWNRRPVCALCGGKTHFMASPGPSTPYRPLLSGAMAEAARREFLRSFGFTGRDVRRIQAMAEAMDDRGEPRALNDLDVPFRVGCCQPGHEGYSSGRILGEWRGRTLLFWAMNAPEEDAWRRKRRGGPKLVPAVRTRGR